MNVSICKLLSEPWEALFMTYEFSKDRIVSSVSFISNVSCSYSGALLIDTTLNVKCLEKQVTENDFESCTDYDISNLDSVLQSEEWEQELDSEVVNYNSLDMKHRENGY